MINDKTHNKPRSGTNLRFASLCRAAWSLSGVADWLTIEENQILPLNHQLMGLAIYCILKTVGSLDRIETIISTSLREKPRFQSALFRFQRKTPFRQGVVSAEL